MAKAADKLNRVAPWRFLLFFALLAAGGSTGSLLLGLVPGLLTGFNVAATVFLMACITTLLIGFFFNLGVLALTINVLGAS